MNKRVLQGSFISAAVTVAAVLAFGTIVFAATAPTTQPATNITTSDATLNGTGGDTDATESAFWVSTSTFSVAPSTNPVLPDGVYGTGNIGAVASSTNFSSPLSSATIPAGLLPITASTTYYFVAWTYDGTTWTPGSVLNFNTASNPPTTFPVHDGANGYTTIQAAVDAASAGDTITVDAGTYHEHVVINKALTINGANSGLTGTSTSRTAESIVDGDGSGASFAVSADGVTLDGFTVQDGGGALNAGIWMGNPDPQNVTIENSIVTANMFGIWADCGGNCVIQNNLFNGNNLSSPTGNGSISADSTIGLTIRNNEFENEVAGNPILLQATAPTSNTNVTVSGNYFHDNTNSNVYVLGVSGGTFSGNTILPAANATGFSFSSADNNITVTDNTISNGARAIRIEDAYSIASSSAFTINDNRFSGNTEYALGLLGGTSTVSDIIDATGNWWGNASGPTVATNPGGTGDPIVVTGMSSNKVETDYINYGSFCSNSTCPAPTLPTCIAGNTFDTFTLGSVNGQGGWSSTGSDDQAVVLNTNNYAGFGCQSLRISNAVTSGGFGDQVFSPSINEAGETTASSTNMSSGIRENHFDAQFSIASAVPGAQQPGLALSVSPDRGDGSRMSFLRFEDGTDGIDVFFDDVTDAGPVGTTATFNETEIAGGTATTSALDRTVPHTIKFDMSFVDGPANDVVNIYIDGNLVHTGTSWEDYYRYDPEQTPSGNVVPTVDSLLFRVKPPAVPANAGKGFLIDLVSNPGTPILAEVTAVPTPSQNTTPNYTFSSSEAGTIAYGGDCSAATSTAIAGNNTVAFNSLATGTHSNCTITVTDAAQNVSSPLAVSSFEVQSAPSTSSGGGGGGGGGGNGPIASGGGGGGGGPVAVALPNNGGAPGGTSSIPSGTGSGTGSGSGQVLGASTFNFTRDLTIGSTGDDVTALQQTLIAQGFPIPLLTSGATAYGYFGAQTRAAVAAFQVAHGITPTAGYFGPITRSIMNAGVTPTMSDEQRSLLIQTLQNELNSILQQIAAMKAAGITQ